MAMLVISHNQMVNPSFLMFHSAFLAAADSLQDIRFNSGQWTTCLSSLLWDRMTDGSHRAKRNRIDQWLFRLVAVWSMVLSTESPVLFTAAYRLWLTTADRSEQVRTVESSSFHSKLHMINGYTSTVI